MTRPFLVRDAPYPLRVVSAPSTPPPRANSHAPAPLGRHASWPGLRSSCIPGKQKGRRWCTIGSPMSNIWAHRTRWKTRRSALSTPFSRPRGLYRPTGMTLLRHRPRGAVCRGLVTSRTRREVPSGRTDSGLDAQQVLARPHPASPCPALPHPASPCPALPRPAPPCLPPPRPASPCLTPRPSSSAEGSS